MPHAFTGRLSPHRDRKPLLYSPLEQALAAFGVRHELGINVVPLGGQLDDLLVDVAEP
jgi:hypothetical protein